MKAFRKLLRISVGALCFFSTLSIGTQVAFATTITTSKPTNPQIIPPAKKAEKKEILKKALGNEKKPLLAKKRRRKKSKKVRRPKKRRRSSARSSGGKKNYAKTSAKGMVGIVSGLEGISDTVLVYGGDFLMPLGKNLNFQGGLTYWLYDIQEEFFAARTSLMTFAGGVGYILPLGKDMWIEGAGQVLFATLTVDAATDNGLGEVQETSASESSAGLFINGSFHYNLGGMNVGPEFRMPIFFSDKYENFNATYLMFFLELNL